MVPEFYRSNCHILFTRQSDIVFLFDEAQSMTSFRKECRNIALTFPVTWDSSVFFLVLPHIYAIRGAIQVYRRAIRWICYLFVRKYSLGAISRGRSGAPASLRGI